MTTSSPTDRDRSAKFAQSLARLIHPALLVPDLGADGKIGALKELVDLLYERGVVADKLNFLQSVLERESLQSTILDGEVALPHARSRSVRRLGLALGIAPRPIDFPSGDERREVRLICLIAVPASAPDLYLNLLGGLARVLGDAGRRAALIAADSPAAMQRALLGAAI